MVKNIYLEDACKAVCSYCEAGIPLRDGVHIREFGKFMEMGTDTKYPCRAFGIRKIVVSVRKSYAGRT